MARLKLLILAIIVLLAFNGCDYKLSKSNKEDKVDRVSDITDEEERKDSYLFTLDITPSKGSENIEIIEHGNYDNSLKLIDSDNNVLYESKRGELTGRIVEIEILDFNRDNWIDLLIVADAGGSSGAYLYHLYTYKNGEFKGRNLNEFNASIKFEVEIEDNSVIITFKESNNKKVIEFSENTKSTLMELEIDIPSNYYWGPEIISHYYNNNSELVIVSRNQIMIEHKLLVVVEVIVEYTIRDGIWTPIEWEINEKQ